MSKMANLAFRHGKNLLRTGVFVLMSSVVSSELKNSTAETTREIAKDIRVARNMMREHREAI